MITRKLAFPSGAQRSVLGGSFGIKPRARWLNEKAAVPDKDAKEYFAQAGVTSGPARNQLAAFIHGLKDLGAWSVANCMAMRFSQNRPTGAVVHRFGGAGPAGSSSITGTIARDNGGISLTGTQRAITTGSTTTILQNETKMKFSFFIVCQATGTTGGDVGGAFDRSAGNSARQWFRIGRIASSSTYTATVRDDGTNYTATITPPNSINNFNFLSMGTVGADTITTINGTAGGTITGQAPKNTSSATIFSSAAYSAAFNGGLTGRVAFCMTVTGNELTQLQHFQLYHLYKKTLGRGLGLD